MIPMHIPMRQRSHSCDDPDVAHVDASARPRVRWVDAEEDKVARLDLVQVVHGLGEVVLLVRVPRCTGRADALANAA